jgi:hypothetical protein
VDTSGIYIRNHGNRHTPESRKIVITPPRTKLTVLQFLEAPDFRNVTLECLAEITGLNVTVGPEHDPKFVILFTMVMTSVNRMIPPSTNIAAAYSSASDAGQELVLNLAHFVSNLLSTHLRAVETEANRDVLLNAHLYMAKISQVDEREILKIALEYWSKLVAELYDEIQAIPIGESGLLMDLSVTKVRSILLKYSCHSDHVCMTSPGVYIRGYCSGRTSCSPHSQLEQQGIKPLHEYGLAYEV